MEQGHSGTVVQVCFPVAQTAVLDGLNRQREEGRFCDLSIHVQGQVFKAHRCVLAASSPYFHDQVLLKNMSTVSIPAVMDPLAFESVLRCAYTGQLRMLRDDIVNYLTVGSVLQMWHIVDKCTELLREAKGGGGGGGGGGSGTALVSRGSQENPEGGGGNGENPSGSSSSVVLLHSRSADHQPPHHHHQSHGRPSLSESQSPSSTNYFSPREANCGGGGGGGGSASTSGSGGEGQGQGLSSTPSYCAPSGRSEETFLIEGDEDDEDEGLEEEEEDDDTLYLSSRKRERGRHRRKKLSLSGCDQGVGISDSFGVSSYQDGDAPSPPPPPPQKRPTYSQPSIMPRKQWVVVKTERSPDDELIVVSGGEEGGEDDDEEDKELEMARERARELERERAFSISNVRTLSDELSSRAEAEMETQVDYCQSSEDYLKYDSGLLDHPSQQHPLDHTGQGSSSSSSRSISALLGPLQSAAARAQLFPLDMQGNQILLYSQAALDSSPLGMGSGLSGSALKGPGLEHGAAHLSGQGGGLEGLDAMAPGGAGGSGGKVFMCHCGKTFTHKSMRDRHINMHLDLRPFHCPVCAKKFKMKHHLTEHMKTHTGLKPYVCSGCGKKFMWRDSFMRHRSQCERRGIGGGGGGGGGGSMEAGGSQDAQGLSPTHPLQSDAMQVGSEGRNGVGGRGGLGGGSPHHQPSPGGGGGGSMPCLGMAGPVSLLGIGAQGLGSGIFGLGMSRVPCEDDVCEVSVDESNIA